MFRNILVPLDGSPFAEQALPWALALARRTQGQLHLVRVHVLYALKDPAASWAPYDPEEDQECRTQEQLYLDGTSRWLAQTAPVQVNGVLAGGLPVDGILGRVHAEHADLVVMTTHGRGAFSRFFLGSVADELLRRAEVPVLLVRPAERALGLIPEPAPHRVIIPLDGSPLAEQVLEPALQLARLLECACTLVRVAPPRGPDGGDEFEAADYLQKVAANHARGLAIGREVLVRANVAAALSSLATPNDVVAIATHGAGGVRRMVLGSVADKIIRATSGAVLVYRPAAGK